MKNNTRKIVVLDSLNSPEIEQAIFILRDKSIVSSVSAVNEAQRIVDSYLQTLSNSVKHPHSQKKNNVKFWIGIMLYTFAMVTLTAYLLSFIS